MRKNQTCRVGINEKLNRISIADFSAKEYL